MKNWLKPMTLAVVVEEEKEQLQRGEGGLLRYMRNEESTGDGRRR